MITTEIYAESAAAVAVGFGKTRLKISTKTLIPADERLVLGRRSWFLYAGRSYSLTMATPVGTGPIVQDVAPKGGYPPIQIARRLPDSRGPRGIVIIGLVSLTMALGYYKLGQANKVRRAERHEKRLARIALMPMLQAEEDRKMVLTKRFQQELQKGMHESLEAWKQEHELE